MKLTINRSSLWFWTWLLVLAYCHIALGSEIETRSTVYLGIGEQRYIPSPPFKNFTTGTSAVIQVLPPGRFLNSTNASPTDGLLIRGLKSGSTDIWFVLHNRAIHQPIEVVSDRSGPFPAGFLKSVGGFQEIEVILTDDKVLLWGTIKTLTEARRVFLAKTRNPTRLIDRTILHPSLVVEAERILLDWISSTKSNVRLSTVDHKLTLKGDFKTEDSLATFKTQAVERFPLVTFETTVQTWKNASVFFQVFLLELKRDQFKSLGVSWPGGQEAAAILTTSHFTNQLSLPLALRSLETEGSLKILSKPKILVQVPGEAELFSGGELPIHQKSVYSSKYDWKPFGLLLKLNVHSLEEGRIKLGIHSEMSSLDAKIAQDEVPGLRLNRLKTQIQASMGRPILLCGLIQEDLRTQAKGLPFLRRIPILGSLFGSEDFQEERSELVAILIPNSEPPPAPLERVEEEAFLGFTPPPRNWLSAEAIQSLKASPNYPWNALE